MRASDLVGQAIRATFRSKLRSSLTVLAIFVGAFTLTLTSAIGTGVSSYISTQVAAIGAPNQLVVTATTPTSAAGSGPAKYSASSGQTVQGRAGQSVAALTKADVRTIAHIAGVQSVTPTLRVTPDWIREGSGQRYVLTLTSLPVAITADLAAGAQLTENAAGNELLLPTTYLSSLGFSSAADAVGATVHIGITDQLGASHVVNARVVGVQNTTLFSSGVTINQTLRSALSSAQQTGRAKGVATEYASAVATVAKGATAAEITKVKHRLSDKGFTGQTIADQLGTLETVINGIVGVLDAFAVIALIAAAFGIVNTLLMSVQERTREIGLMKAMGLGNGRVFALFSLEAIVLGLLGSGLGALVAVLIGTPISARLSKTVLSDLPGLDILQFSPVAIAVIMGVVSLIAFLSGSLPARRAAKLDPIEALRYE